MPGPDNAKWNSKVHSHDFALSAMDKTERAIAEAFFKGIIKQVSGAKAKWHVNQAIRTHRSQDHNPITPVHRPGLRTPDIEASA